MKTLTCHNTGLCLGISLETIESHEGFSERGMIRLNTWKRWRGAGRCKLDTGGRLNRICWCIENGRRLILASLCSSKWKLWLPFFLNVYQHHLLGVYFTLLAEMVHDSKYTRIAFEMFAINFVICVYVWELPFPVGSQIHSRIIVCWWVWVLFITKENP